MNSVSGEHHERAVEAAANTLWSHTTSAQGICHPLSRDRRTPSAAEEIIDAYFASLAEQGVRLVDLREVVEWLRARHRPQAAVFWADALERHFGSVSE